MRVDAGRYRLVADTLRAGTLARAEQARAAAPVTVTASTCPRSPGGPHDFYSEGDYWWPDPAHPGGPYVRRDGETNPDNFVDHRHAMVRLARLVGVLASGYRLTGDERYVDALVAHVQAWFVDPTTAMHPNLQYGQAITGRVTGRGIGIIDTVQLVEVAQALWVVQGSSAVPAATLAGARRWFAAYVQWLTSHPYGRAERDEPNNHGSCWLLQVAAFALLAGPAAGLAGDGLVDDCRARFARLLTTQQAADGSFPLELARTKPYGYSIFNADGMAALGVLLSTRGHDLWQRSGAVGERLHRAFGFLHPYLADKSRWPYPHDVSHFDDWPVASPGLLFAALAGDRDDWLQTWLVGEHWPTDDEVLRNLPVRHPLLWLTVAQR